MSSMMDQSRKRMLARQNPMGYAGNPLDLEAKQQSILEGPEMMASNSALTQPQVRNRPLTEPAGLTEEERRNRDKKDKEQYKVMVQAEREQEKAEQQMEKEAFSKSFGTGVWTKMKNTMG